MTVDANYFDGWEHRMKSLTKAEIKDAQRYCYCGHILGVHFAMQIAEPGRQGGITIRHGKWRCHAMSCVCEKWRWDKRLRSKIKRKIGKRSK
jgi:hypothetical protein